MSANQFRSCQLLLYFDRNSFDIPGTRLNFYQNKKTDKSFATLAAIVDNFGCNLKTKFLMPFGIPMSGQINVFLL